MSKERPAWTGLVGASRVAVDEDSIESAPAPASGTGPARRRQSAPSSTPSAPTEDARASARQGTVQSLGVGSWPLLGVRAPKEQKDALAEEVLWMRETGRRRESMQSLVTEIIDSFLASRPAHSEYARELQRARGIDPESFEE